METKFLEFFIDENNYLFNRDNIALFTILKEKNDSPCIFIIANTHLLFNKKRGNIKLSQLNVITKILGDLQKFYRIKANKKRKKLNK